MDFFQFGVELQGDFAGGDFVVQLVKHDFFGAEGVATVDEGNVRGEVGEVKRFFHGGVAAADYGHRFVAVEESVAGGAGGNTPAFVGLFGRQAEVFGARPGRDDDGFGGVGVIAGGHAKGVGGEINGGDKVAHDGGLEAFGVRQHVLHQLRALDAFRRSGPVVHFGGGHQLSALFEAGNENRVQTGTGSIHGSGVSGRAGTDDEDFGWDHGGFLKYGGNVDMGMGPFFSIHG